MNRMVDIKKFKKRILVTGGAGFIGSEVIRHFVKKYPDYLIVCFDCLTYAGNLENLKPVENEPNYVFSNGDIRDYGHIATVFNEYLITDVIHLAAESHVDRSIDGPRAFVETNVIGTFNLLEMARHKWRDEYEKHRFHHVSTDEVYGSLKLGDATYFHEDTKYDPHSPYSASKASSDHFVKAYHDTYGMNVTISNCSNNYGPYQFPEKLIPLAINNLKNGNKIPVYGKGDNVRDWLYVGDHAKAIDIIFHKGKPGETYNVGGMCEKSNMEIVEEIIVQYFWNKKLAEVLETAESIEEIKEKAKLNINLSDYIEYVEDRKGHDKRYAIDCSKLIEELDWVPEVPFEIGIQETIKWYLTNDEWLKNVTSGAYKEYYNKQYGEKTVQK